MRFWLLTFSQLIYWANVWFPKSGRLVSQMAFLISIKIVWWDRCTHLPKSFQTYCPIISFLRTANDVEGALLDLKQTGVNSAFLYLSCFVYMTLGKCHDSKIDTRIRYNIETQIYCNSVCHANMKGYCLQRSCSLVVYNVCFLTLIDRIKEL